MERWVFRRTFVAHPSLNRPRVNRDRTGPVPKKARPYVLNRGAGGGNRTRTTLSGPGILSPVRLPVSPPRPLPSCYASAATVVSRRRVAAALVPSFAVADRHIEARRARCAAGSLTSFSKGRAGPVV